jgi:hypothetical protein
VEYSDEAILAILGGAGHDADARYPLRVVSESIDRERLLRDLGYGHPQALARALEVLVARGLTIPRKTAIAAEKRPRIVAALEAALVRLCSRCIGEPPKDGRVPVPVEDATDCQRCGGSSNRLALQRAAEACRRRGVRRVVVVGGAPGIHKVLRQLWPNGIDLRIVSGTERHTGLQARANLDWADVVVVWAATELDHKVSLLYTKARSRKVVVAPRRGIEALAKAIVEHLER